MVVKLFGPSGDHCGWMLEGDIFGIDYEPLAFAHGDDLYSFSGRWLGSYDKGAVYDRTGIPVATAWGQRATRILPSRLGRMPPRIKPVPSALPCDIRPKDAMEASFNSHRWAGMSMGQWLEQSDT